MDSLTQIVLGAAVGEVVLGRKVGYRAALWGAIGGTIPDLDVLLTSFTTFVTGIYHHRGFSHSIVFCLLLAPIMGKLIQWIYKKKRGGWWDWSWLMFWALFTHPILDCFTTWGTRIFWPSNARVSFQNIFVIDPLYTLPFMFCLIMALRLKKDHPNRGKWMWSGILISCLYIGFTFWSKAQANAVFEAAWEEQGLEIVRMESRPTPLNSFLWTANLEVEEGYYIAYHSLFDDDAKDISFDFVQKRHELLDPYRGDEELGMLLHLTQGWYSVDDSSPDTLYVNDLRFGQYWGFKEKPFVFRYQLTIADGKLVIDEPDDLNRPEGDRFNALLNSLWCRIWGEELSPT